MKKIRKELRYQLGCIRRNLDYIEDYAAEYGLDCLFRVQRERLLTIVVFYDQQKEMLDTKTHHIADRIVSLSQPWVRPIVRGKSKAPTEFGAKISVSVVNGYTFIDRFTFDAYNEGEASEFKRSKSNREFCKSHSIRLSGPKLGRPGKDHVSDIRQELKEIGERNAVEGKFGNGKRKLGLALIMAKLQVTAGSMIGMDIFILNMEKLMKQGVSLLSAFLEVCIIRPYPTGRQLTTDVISGCWALV